MLTNKHGVTLLELLMTLSIISILLLFALCSFDAMANKQKLETAAKQISYTFDTARYIAEKSGYTASVKLNENTGNYSIESNGAVLTNNDRYGSDSGVLPENIKILDNKCGQIGFQPNGSIDKTSITIAGDCDILIGYTSGINKNLTFRLATGSVDYE